jgi:hypothetical protein
VSHFTLAISCTFVLWLAFAQEAAAKSLIELKTQSKIAKGEPALFKAKVLGPGVKKIRLRYRNAAEKNFKWVDFEKRTGDEQWASIESSEISDLVIDYYIVLQKDDGSVEMLYGSPDQPHHITIDRRATKAVVYKNALYHNAKARSSDIKDRFGDDDVLEQMSVLSAFDSHHSLNRFEKWGKTSSRMSAQEIQQIGKRELREFLTFFPQIDFLQGATPVLRGLSAQSRLKLKVDGLELYNEYDGSSFWNMDMMNVATAAIKEGPTDVIGESGGLLGTIDVDSSRKLGLTAKVGGGLPAELVAGFFVGQKIAGVDNYWTTVIGQEYPNGLLNISSILRSEYWWNLEKRPFMTANFQIFAVVPDERESFSVTWNGRVGFELPLTKNLDSRLSISAGQSFHQDYRLSRTKLLFENEIALSARHALAVNAQVAFVGLAMPEDARRCEIFGLATNLANACRMSGSILLKDKVQFTDWVALSSGLEITAATKEINDAESLLHPSALLELAPHENVELNVGYTSSMRWPTFLEKKMNDMAVSPEKMRLVTLGTRFELPAEYAFVSFELQGRSVWLVDAIGPKAEALGTIHALGLNAMVVAKLASANQLFFGSEVHTESAIFPKLKLVLGARLNLLKLGSMYFEMQILSLASSRDLEHSRMQVFYQSRPFWDHVQVDARIAKSLDSDAFHAFLNMKFSV